VIANTSPRGRVGLVIGLVVAAAGIVGVLVYVHAQTTQQQQTTKSVVVAKQDIPAATEITSSMLTTKDVPSDQIPAGSYTDQSLVVGEFPLYDIPPGTVILSSEISGTGSVETSPGPNGTTTTPSQVTSGFPLKPGYVAMAMPVDPELAVGYYIQPHDHVDFIVAASNVPPAQQSVRYGFQDVEILAVGGSLGVANAGGTAPNSARTDGLIVVALPRRQAEELARMLGGSTASPLSIVRLVLRPRSDYGKGYLDSGDTSPFQGHQPNDPPVTPDTLNSMFR
jgi:Flp pilus assembly protein CpaB